jgi:GNAT superfamily N-acetyltransferase
MTRSIRPAVATDAATLARIQAESWRAAFQGLLSDDYLAGLDLAALQATWSGHLAEARWPGAGTLVLEDAGQAVGYSRFYPTADTDADPARVAMIGSMYTVPAVWRTGAGRLLMTTVLETLTDARYATAALWVLEGNSRARAFYQAHGWSPDGARQADSEMVKLRYTVELKPPR